MTITLSLPSRSPARRTWLLCAVVLLLGACSGAPPKRVFPPSVSVQQLQRSEDGSWRLQLRLQNFSTVAMRFDRVEARLSIAGNEAARIEFDPALMVPPNSAEPVSLDVTPSAAAAAAVTAALDARRAVDYRIEGTVESSEPKRRRDPFDFSSALSPTPGLSGVLR